jgi:hypothetical protein
MHKAVPGTPYGRGGRIFAEVTGSDRLGIWITVAGVPYFVAHEKTRWLRDPAVRGMLGMDLPNGLHLHWDSLGIDIDLDAL